MSKEYDEYLENHRNAVIKAYQWISTYIPEFLGTNEAPKTDCCKWFYGVSNNKWYRTSCGMYYDRKSKITAKNIKKGVCPYCKRKIQIKEY